MKKMLKRADGSYSQRGLWDNIRAKAAANKKAGKKGKAPSEDILEQEEKIESKKMGGKPNWLMESQELKFGGPTKKYQSAGFKGCVSGECRQVMNEKGTTYAGNGSNYTGVGSSFNATTPRYTLNIVNQTPEEKAAGLANQAKYRSEGDARMEAKKYEAYLRSGKGDYSTGMDSEMVKDKGVIETKFYTRKSKTGGKRKSNKIK